MVITEFFSRMKFWRSVDRLGPDILGTHYKLYFKKAGNKLCKKKFKYFGDGAEFRPGAYAFGCSKIHIGNRVIVRPTSMLFADTRENGAEIIIEDGVLMGSGVQVYVVNHKFDNPDIPIIDQGHYDSKTVILKKGCWLGANVIILPGVTIGENTVVGAGSVVSKSIPEKVLAAGNPAKIIKSLSSDLV